MPLEELLAIYRYEASAGSSIDSSSGDLTDELPDMTLDKVKDDSHDGICIIRRSCALKVKRIHSWSHCNATHCVSIGGNSQGPALWRLRGGDPVLG